MMETKESIERFSEGLRMAADRARELGSLQNLPVWKTIAASLDTLRENGEYLIRHKAMTRNEVLAELDRQQVQRALKADKAT